MKIGINLLYLLPGVVGGTETYASGLLSGFRKIGSKHDFILFVNEETKEWAEKIAPMMRKVVCPVTGSNRQRRYFFEQLKLPRLVEEHKVDILHSLGYTTPLFTSFPTVVTVLDLNFKAFGQSMPLKRRLALSFFVRRAIQRSQRVITISNFSRQEILKHYNVASDKIVVTHLAMSTPDVAEGTETFAEEPTGCDFRPPYCIAFSSPSANKNIPNLVRAFLSLREKKKIQHQLVLVGHKFDDELINRVRKEDGVVQTGYLPPTTLRRVLGSAEFLVFPSSYEGFGLPVLEAMAAGVPVVSSNAGSLPEVAGCAALFFDPHSVDDMATKILQVSSSIKLQSTLRNSGYENLRRFSWEKTAQETLDVYEQVMKRK